MMEKLINRALRGALTVQDEVVKICIARIHSLMSVKGQQYLQRKFICNSAVLGVNSGLHCEGFTTALELTAWPVLDIT